MKISIVAVPESAQKPFLTVKFPAVKEQKIMGLLL